MPVIADQDVLVYQSPSQKAYLGGSHTIQVLKKLYPTWPEESQKYLPFVMRTKIDVRVGLPWGKPQLKILRQDIKTIVSDLPVSFRSGYERLIEELEKDDPIAMDIPRAIEYLTMVQARYILDCIRTAKPTLPVVLFDGLTLPSTVKGKRSRSRVWIFHNHRSPDIDILLIECQALAVERIRAIISGKRMNLLRILRIKCRKFKPAELIKKRGLFGIMGMF